MKRYGYTIKRNGVSILKSCFYAYSRQRQHSLKCLSVSILALQGAACAAPQDAAETQPKTATTVSEPLKSKAVVGVPSPLHEAVRRKDLLEAERLLNSGANPAARDALGRTALHYAAALKDHDMVALLIKFGSDADARDNDGYSPLHRSVQQGDLEITRKLLEAGADPHAKAKSDATPISIAKENSRNDLEEVLKGKNP